MHPSEHRCTQCGKSQHGIKSIRPQNMWSQYFALALLVQDGGEARALISWNAMRSSCCNEKQIVCFCHLLKQMRKIKCLLPTTLGVTPPRSRHPRRFTHPAARSRSVVV